MAVGDRLPEASVAADVDPERAVEVADAALDAANRLGHDVRRHPGSVPPRIETKKSAQHVTTRLGPPGGEDPELPPDPPDRSPLCRSLADRVTGSYGIVVGKGLEYYTGFGLARGQRTSSSRQRDDELARVGSHELRRLNVKADP